MAPRLNHLFIASVRNLTSYYTRNSFQCRPNHSPSSNLRIFNRIIPMDSELSSDFHQDSFDDHMDSESFSPEEYFGCPPLLRRKSTIEDEQKMIILLTEILAYQDKQVSSWIVENNVKNLIGIYKLLTKPQKEGFLKTLATKFSVDHDRLQKAMNHFKDCKIGTAPSLKAEEQLKSVLNPQYSWLFKCIGRLENGVKILVDMRTDLLDLLSSIDNRHEAYIALQQLNSTLRDLLSLWFSVGFLQLERVTWKSSCEMLQKISEYEAVHPVRSWADLKRRVGLYRRCFVYTHNSMPSEPIVVLHTALSTEIASSMKGIVQAAHRMSVDASMKEPLLCSGEVEDANLVSAAIFYSITSTQRGLQGIELGNYLIKRVVRELQAEFPRVNQFSTLSPIPGFKPWLIDKIKAYEKGEQEYSDLWKPILEKLGEWKDVKRCLHNNSWLHDHSLALLLEPVLMASCARYLYKEKRRGAALCSVANFHLKNGAVMWRLNWLADLSPRGMTNSCGIMVNYRYFIEENLEENSQNYIENKVINASEQIKQLVGDKIPSKM